MGGERHGFLTTGNNDVGITAGDLLHADGDGAQARTADLVEPPGGGLFRQAGGDGCLARGVLSLAGREHLTENHLVHLFRRDAGARKRLANGGCTKLMRWHGGEGTVERADRGAGGAGNDNGFG